MTREWRNWGGNQTVRPREVLTPRSVDELAAGITRAAAQGRGVTAVGSGHSFTAIALAPDVQVDLSRMCGVIALDRRTGLVEVGAGMTLRRLNEVLALAGLGLSNLGDVDRQSVAGALSTGTHGTGAGVGGLATQVRGLELVLADGSVVRAGADEHPELFSAARIGLGALGIITSVTLQAERAFALRAVERAEPLGAVLARLDELVAENEHFELYWFPHTTRGLTKANNRVGDGAGPPLSRARSFVADELVSNGLFDLTCRLGRLAPPLVPGINAVAARLLGDREYVAPSHAVFTSPRRVRFVESEHAVPRAAVADALAGIRHVIDRSGLRVSFPVEVRFAAADDVPLSTANDRDSAYLAVHMFRGEPFQRYFREVAAVMAEHGGRPHWGKLHDQDAASLRPLYPRFDDFLAVRDTVDPRGVFSNAYVQRVLGPAKEQQP